MRMMTRMMCALVLLAATSAVAEEEAAAPTASGSAQNNAAPDWYKQGALVYRVSTPDEDDVLGELEQGSAIVFHLLDGTVTQITILNGIIGHDRRGAWNWDGAWPYLNRVTFRANHSWSDLHDFMARCRDKYKTYHSFHANITDVNVGLKDDPETREFFDKLVKAKAIYRRDRDPETNARDQEPPYVPEGFPKNEDNPVKIFALVNYKNFWESGLAKEMIDEFYGKLPYAPPLLYLDVLTLQGGNFSAGYPTGPLGGSEETQRQGRDAIVAYLRQLGTEVATEGTGTMRQIDSAYGWYHGQGYSDDDYSAITGGYHWPEVEQTYGSAGAFNVSPIANTKHGLETVRQHYEALLAGKPGTKVVADLSTAHVCIRTESDEFDIPGTGDKFRGDYADLVNNFYLVNIQELYHVGKGNVRVSKHTSGGYHLDKALLTSPSGNEIVLEAEEFVRGWRRAGALEAGKEVVMAPHFMSVDIEEPGMYELRFRVNAQDQDAQMNIYVNGKKVAYKELKKTSPRPLSADWPIVEVPPTQLKKGENSIALDVGPIRAEWSDGTQAVWDTPALHQGFRVWRGDVVFADDYDRMWPDTWSGEKKIYFFSWDGTQRQWRLPESWALEESAQLHPLTPTGRGKAVPMNVEDGTISPNLLPQVPYVLTPVAK